MTHTSRVLLASLTLLGCASGRVDVLERDSTIRGRLTDETGRPIEGVQVRASPIAQGGRCDTTESDRDGRFLLSGLEAGSCVVAGNRGPGASRKWYEASCVARVGSTVDLVLTRTPWIVGLVTDATTGRPLRGARVIVEMESGTPLTYTDEAGRFEEWGLSEGLLEVTVSARERQRSTVVEIRRGVANTLEIELRGEDEIRDEEFQVRPRLEADAPPVWFDLGGVNYFRSGADEAFSILSLSAEPRWFRSFQAGGLPPPTSIEAIPLTDQGASLDLQIAPDELDPRLLRVRVVLRANGRALDREVEHRHTNILPFLFAVRAEGQTVASRSAVYEGVRLGGANGMVDLVPAGGRRTWDLTVTARSLERLLPRPLPGKLEIVVAFSERQHEPVDMLDDRGVEHMSGPANRRDLLVRSEMVRLTRRETSWYPVD